MLSNFPVRVTWAAYKNISVSYRYLYRDEGREHSKNINILRCSLPLWYKIEVQKGENLCALMKWGENRTFRNQS